MGNIHISHTIHHIFQGEDGLCWASAVAMLLGRRSIEGAHHVAETAGINRENMAIENSEIPHALRANGVRLVDVPSPLTVESLANIIRPRPAVFFVRVRDGQHASNGGYKHVIVIRGMSGDGSPNTNVYVNDPWETGGDTETFAYLTTQYWSSIDYIGRR
jgi:hypothetical protein